MIAQYLIDVDKLTKAGKELGSYIAQQVGHYGPQAYDLILQITRVNAAAELITHLFWTISTLILSIIYIPKLWKWASDHIYESDGGSILVPGLAIIFSGFILLFNSGGCLDIWSWVGVFRPDLALAHQIVQKVFGQ